MPENGNPTTFWQHVGKIVHRTFHPFSWGRDLVIATAIAFLSLYIQAKKSLIPDWREHWEWWILSYLIPYAGFLLLHIAYRFVEAPWRLQQELEMEHSIIRNTLATKLTVVEQQNALLQEHLSKRNFPENRPRITVDRWGQQVTPTGVLRPEAGFYLTNHGETALEVILEDFTLGPEKWVGEKLSSIEGRQKGFMKVERVTFVYEDAQRWNLLDGFRVARKNEQRVRVRYRDFNNNWYRSTATLTCAPNFGSIELGASTQEPLGSS